MLDFEGFIQTQPLWKGNFQGLQQFNMPETDLSSLEQIPIPKNLRLGHRVEHVFAQLINHSDQYDLIAHNLQIQKEKITLGELDFILRDRSTHKLLHVELSYKFYILDPSLETPIQRAMGPNRKDQFFAKMNKTKEKQLPIIYSKEGRQALAPYNIEAEDLSQQVCFLGQLFLPFKGTDLSFAPFPKNCIVGFWIGFKEFSILNSESTNFYMPKKAEWLHEPHEDVVWCTHDKISNLILEQHQEKRAPLIWLRLKKNQYQKCFVVWWDAEV